MSTQTFLDIDMAQRGHPKRDVSNRLKILNWNLRNPSQGRAVRQCRSLERLHADFLVLTELKSLRGIKYIHDRLSCLGYNLYYSVPAHNNYFTVIATKLQASETPLPTNFLPQRVVGIKTVKMDKRELKIIGIYAPSRGPIGKRNVEKKRFQTSVMEMLDYLCQSEDTSCLIICGDLNVIEPEHVPKYAVFQEWEFQFYRKFIDIGMIDAFRYLNSSQDYSWFGRERDGYRFDHIFVSNDLKDYLKRCYYNHEVRDKKLSDHSAMILELEL